MIIVWSSLLQKDHQKPYDYFYFCDNVYSVIVFITSYWTIRSTDDCLYAVVMMIFVIEFIYKKVVIIFILWFNDF